MDAWEGLIVYARPDDRSDGVYLFRCPAVVGVLTNRNY